MNIEVEEKLLRSFVVPEKREQYMSRLALPNARQKFMNSHFFHMRDLDPRFAARIDRSEQTAGEIYLMLRERGAPSHCYVLSGSSDRDGTETDLRQALEETVGSVGGTFLSCVHGALAYFEGEEPNERFLLQRQAGVT